MKQKTQSFRFSWPLENMSLIAAGGAVLLMLVALIDYARGGIEAMRPWMGGAMALMILGVILLGFIPEDRLRLRWPKPPIR